MLACSSALSAESLVIEAERFEKPGGWTVDTQFIETMGSAYLIAHGPGNPVADASTSVDIPAEGKYQVWVRTMDWSEALKRKGGAGRFNLSIGGKILGGELGKGESSWHWESVGSIDLTAGKTELKLTDLSNYNGRVDAIFLSNDGNATPPLKCQVADRAAWDIPGALEIVEESKEYDLVVVGGDRCGKLLC